MRKVLLSLLIVLLFVAPVMAANIINGVTGYTVINGVTAPTVVNGVAQTWITTETIYLAADGDYGRVEASNAVYADVVAGTAFNGGASTSGPGRNLYTNYYITQVFFRFDTSTIPDGATIATAKLYLYGAGSKVDTDNRSLTGEYFAWTPPVTTSEWVHDAASTDAFSVDITGLSGTDWNEITLGTLTSINKTGYTGFRLSVSGAAPTSGNYQYFQAYNGGTNEPYLVITY